MRKTLALAALVLALAGGWPSSPALAGDKAAETALTKEFNSKYQSEDGGERAKAVEALREAPDAIKIDLIAGKVVPEEKRADVLAAAIEVLSRVKDQTVAERIVTLSRTAATAEQRVVYVEAMAGMSWSGTAHRGLLELLKDKELWVRAMAAWSLGEHRTPDALDPLIAALSDKTWQVQASALSAIPRLSDKALLRSKAVPALIDFVEDSSGRTREDAADALRRITGKKFGRDVAAWRKWLVDGDAPAPAKPTEGESPPAADNPYAPVPSEKPHFYGVDVASNRFVIVFDQSMSMGDPLTIDRDRLRRETSRRRATTGEGPKPDAAAKEEDLGFDIPWWKIKTKLDLARWQTINLITGLAPDQNFEILFFSTKVEPWMGRLVPATQPNKLKAVAHLETLKWVSETDMWAAFAAAFEMSEKHARTGFAPDEIFFVTDGGVCSKGDIIDSDQICEAVMQLAKVHQMRINVVAIGINLTWLRKLALATGGQYRTF